jgi:hypothetical protein
VKKEERHHFYRLYSGRRRLTIQEKESIIDSVIEKTLQKEPRRWWSWRLSSMGARVAFATGVALLMAAPVLWLTQQSEVTDEFTVRGSDPKPMFSVTCPASGTSSACRRGDKLVFRLFAPDKTLFFSAFSRHEKSGAVVWYFPRTDRDKGISVSDTVKGDVVPEGIVIGDEHAAGVHEVFGVFSDHEVTRSDIRRLFEENQGVPEEGYAVQSVKVRIEQ